MTANLLNTLDLDRELSDQSPQEIIAYALEQFDNIAISFSGAEDVVLIDMAHRINPEKVQVFSLDTGRLHAETYRFIEKVREHYGIQIDVVFPDAFCVIAVLSKHARQGRHILLNHGRVGTMGQPALVFEVGAMGESAR